MQFFPDESNQFQFLRTMGHAYNRDGHRVSAGEAPRTTTAPRSLGGGGSLRTPRACSAPPGSSSAE